MTDDQKSIGENLEEEKVEEEEKDLDPNERLIEAINIGNLSKVKKLLKKKNVDIHYEYDMPLLNAVRYENLELVEYLIKKKANVNACHGAPIRIAAANGNLEIVKALVENGAYPTYHNREAQRMAKRFGHQEVFAYLKELN